MHCIALTVSLVSSAKHQRSALRIEDAEYIHAAIHRVIGEHDSNLGRELHEMKRNKCLTLAIVNNSAHNATLRLSFIGEHGLRCANTLVAAWAVSPLLHLGRHAFTVSSINLNDSVWGGATTLEALNDGEPCRIMRFQFVTPTAIMKRDQRGNRFSSLWATPQNIFGSLARRWHAINPVSLPDDFELFLEADGCIVSAHRLQTIEFSTSERKQVGFVGWATYSCRYGDTQYVKALNMLTRFAFYAGVGYQTARGMGLTKTNLINNQMAESDVPNVKFGVENEVACL